MINTPPVAPDITTADLQRWVDKFYRETAYAIINDSEDLPEDWKTQIRPQFRTFFLAQDEVREKTGILAFGDNERENENRISEVDRLQIQAEKMLYVRVEQHLDFTEKGIPRLVLLVSGKISDFFSSLSGRGDRLGSTYADEDFLDHTDNTPGSLPKDGKPRDYHNGDSSLFS